MFFAQSRVPNDLRFAFGQSAKVGDARRVGDREALGGNPRGVCRVDPREMPRVPVFIIPVLAGLACSQSPAPHTSPPLAPKLNELVRDQPGPIHYFAAPVDLDGDRIPEWIVHVAGPSVCGTGGCDTMVFKDGENELELITRIPLTRPPIVVADTETDGWRDLMVHVSGGGILPGQDARLRYDGATYAVNPTVPPAEPVAAEMPDEIVIAPFQSFKEGERLR